MPIKRESNGEDTHVGSNKSFKKRKCDKPHFKDSYKDKKCSLCLILGGREDTHTLDRFFFKEKELIVVGGGDTAMEEALFLTRFASKVYVLHRRDELRASKIMQDRALAHDKLEFLWNTEILEFLGDTENGLQGLRISNNKTGEERDLSVHGCFIAIGHDPNTETLTETPISLDEQGYVTPGGLHFPFTLIEGVFVAGDVHDHHYRQAVTAAGHGCAAAIDAERYLEATLGTDNQ